MASQALSAETAPVIADLGAAVSPDRPHRQAQRLTPARKHGLALGAITQDMHGTPELSLQRSPKQGFMLEVFPEQSHILGFDPYLAALIQPAAAQGRNGTKEGVRGGVSLLKQGLDNGLGFRIAYQVRGQVTLLQTPRQATAFIHDQTPCQYLNGLVIP